jgi:hypothetical protein
MLLAEILIPSRSRSQTQKTIFNLSQNLWPYTKIVVPSNQYDDYLHAVPVAIQIIPFSGPMGISIKREYILNMNVGGKVIMMDDDLAFYKRSKDGARFGKTTPTQTEDMVADIVEMLDKYPMVGLTDKFMSHTRPRGLAECQRFNQVLAINRNTLPKPWPNFKDVPHDEEHHFHLQLLTRGHKTAILTEWSKTEVPNAEGGCSDWRNSDVMKQTHDTLMKLWPGIVTVTPNPPRARYNWREAKRRGGII